MATKAEIKGFFQTGDVPTEAQFYAFFDSIYWLAEGLALTGTLNAAGVINIPATRELLKITFWSATGQNVKLGTSVGAGDLFDEELTANTPLSFDLSRFSIAGENVHLTGENLAAINYKFILT